MEERKMARTNTFPAPAESATNTTIRWTLAAFAIGMLIAAVMLP